MTRVCFSQSIAGLVGGGEFDMALNLANVLCYS